MSRNSASVAVSLLPAAVLSEQGKYLSMALTLVVHLLLLAFLFFGIRWTTKVDEAIEVELVSAVSLEAASPPRPVAPEPAPEPRVEPRPEPKVESRPAAPLPKPDIALKESKKEKPKPPLPAEQKPPADPFQKQLEQELKRTAADRQKVEATSAAAKELADFQTAQAAAAKAKAMADYIGRIRGKIKSNIILPADIKGNPEAVFDVVQFPSGEILSVRLKKTSNHAGYDAAVERAILKSSPLPKPERGDLFERELNLKFRPLED